MLFQSAESRCNQWVREHYRFLLRSASALTGSRAIGRRRGARLLCQRLEEPRAVARRNACAGLAVADHAPCRLRHVTPDMQSRDDDARDHRTRRQRVRPARPRRTVAAVRSQRCAGAALPPGAAAHGAAQLPARRRGCAAGRCRQRRRAGDVPARAGARCHRHEYLERTLRGTLMASAPLLQHLGLSANPMVPASRSWCAPATSTATSPFSSPPSSTRAAESPFSPSTTPWR